MKGFAIIQRYWLPLIGLNGTILGCATAMAVLSPRTWTAKTQLILPDTTTNLDTNLGILGQIKDQGIAFTNELNPLQVQTSIITSNDVIHFVWSSDPEKNKYPSIESYKKLFKVKPVDQSTTINIEVQGSLPELAKQRSERLFTSYQLRLNVLRQGTSDSRLKFSRNQLREAEIGLQRAKNQLVRFKQSTGLVKDEEQAKKLIETINSLKIAQAQATAKAQAAKIRAKVLSQRLKMTEQQSMDALRLSQNREYQLLREKLSEIDAEIASTRGDFTDEHPKIQSLLAKRKQLSAALNQQRDSLVVSSSGVDTSFGGNNFKDTTMDLIANLVQADSESKGLQQEALQVQKQINTLQFELKDISANQAKLLDLQRKYDIAEGVYKGIVAQLEQAKISAFNAYPNIQLLDRTTVDPKPTSPKLSLVALGAIASCIFGSFALVLFLESRNALLKPQDLQEIELPVLGRIPTLKSSTAGLRLESATEIGFQRLASTMSLMSLDNRRLMVSSSISGEGKTTVTLGLAAALVVLGFRVLMVDGDFHQAHLSKHFGYTLPRETYILPEPISINNKLDLLPAASIPKDKVMEFVARGGFEEHLGSVQRMGNYDYVIVDTAPLGSMNETALMAKVIANVLLVVRVGVSDRYAVHETLEVLARHNARTVGLTLNDVEDGEKIAFTNRVVPG
ncbi:MAG: AAA family ATPase [Scytonema sp. PMC 1069.18]|nr:AAA family ATPase [Scytonema sp. PMC 1069.18]MEC4887305.1 AAA family ATPase [Scytonema sp. PMC 1070.18]